MKKIEGGITAAKGFQAAGGAAGIKKQGVKDMALVYSEVPCVAAGTFTTNIVKAAPVKWDQEIVYNHPTAQAIVCNSGIANACTGEEGYGYCRKTAEAASAALSIPEDSVLVASTGVIGKQIPIDKIAAGVEMLKPQLAATREAAATAAQAIMTTDTEPKEVAVQIEIGGKTVTIGSMCKGSGMIHPNMGTMLCFITTDCAVSSEMIRKALLFNVKRTFNRVTVDGDTSTNDMCTVLANGMAGNAEITAEDPAYEAFREALQTVMQDLARKIAADGEGASKLMTCTVKGAKDEETAEVLAKSIAGSSLTKAAMFGSDANWGRVLCAMGYSGAAFNTEKVLVEFASKEGSIAVCEDGRGLDFDEDLAKKILSQDEVEINVTLQEGSGSATCWGCDLTYDYVKINGDYRT